MLTALAYQDKTQQKLHIYIYMCVCVCVYTHARTHTHSWVKVFTSVFYISYILLTVHLDAILVNDQLDALFLNVFVFLLTGTSDSHPPECVIPDDVLIQYGPPDDEH
jgi:hypothetical protein